MPVEDAVYHSHNSRFAIGNVYTAEQEISVARDRIVFDMGEQTGNIFSLDLRSSSR